MTHPASVRDALQQARQYFPCAKVLFATDGETVIGDKAWDLAAAITRRDGSEVGVSAAPL